MLLRWLYRLRFRYRCRYQVHATVFDSWLWLAPNATCVMDDSNGRLVGHCARQIRQSAGCRRHIVVPICASSLSLRVKVEMKAFWRVRVTKVRAEALQLALPHAHSYGQVQWGGGPTSTRASQTHTPHIRHTSRTTRKIGARGPGGRGLGTHLCLLI